MANKIYRIKGKVVERSTQNGLRGLRVEAWDKDLLFDDLVGSARTDESGRFEIVFDASYFQELFLDRQPDLYFRVYFKSNMVHSTEEDVLWNLATGDIDLTITVNGGIMSLKPEALMRCDSGIRRLMLMSDDAIVEAVEMEKKRRQRFLEKRSTLDSGPEVDTIRHSGELFQKMTLVPHPVFSTTIVDVLRRFIKIRAIVDFAGNADDLRDLGITVRSCIHNIFTVTATKDQLATLAAQPATRRITTPRWMRPMRAEALGAAQIDTIQDVFLNRGTGSVVAMVDGPVDVMHEAFQNPDGSTRIKFMWVQDPVRDGSGVGPPGSSPDDYFAPLFSDPDDNPFKDWDYGILYDEAAINSALARGPALSDVYGNGTDQIAVVTEELYHGTHTTGIAAGTHIGTRRGAAPDADIVSIVPRYRWYDEVDPEDADAFLEDLTLDAIQCALTLGNHMDQPTVVNLSLGHNLGPHNGNSSFDLALDELLYSWTGRSIVVAAGNNNIDGFHKERLGCGDSRSWDLSSWENKDGLFLDIWSRDVELAIKADVEDQSTDWLVPGSDTSEFENTIVVTRHLSDIDVTVEYPFPVEIFRDPEPISGMHNVRIFIRNFMELYTWTVHIRNDHPTRDSDVWGWVGVQGSLGTLNPYTPDEMSINDNACARSVISVGATNKPVGDAPEEIYSITDDAGVVYYPSGCGPTLDGRIKPDLVAVGKEVSSAWDGTGNDNWRMSGTSQSASVVTGAVALLLAERPNLHPVTIKSLLIQNADKTGLHIDPSDIENYDPFQRNRFGHGRLRLLPIFEDTIDTDEIDVFVRSADDDYGAEPFIGDCFCNAPEVQVQAAEIYDPDAPPTTELEWGQKHAVRVRVHNLSDTPALDTEVRLFYTRPWTAPDVWEECKVECPPEPASCEALTLTLHIPRLGFQDYIFDASSPGGDKCWVPIEDEVPEVDRDWGDHYCLLVEVHNEDDTLEYFDETGETVTPGMEMDVWSRNIKETNNIALKNLHIK